MKAILIVEDSPTQAAEIALILEEAGFATLTAHDGLEALSKLATGGADLVLCDVLMPGISGFELCRRIRSLPDAQNTPVVLVTTLNSLPDIVRGLEAGADAYLNKPFEGEDLIDTVNTFLVPERNQLRAEARARGEAVFMGQRFTIPDDRQRIVSYFLSVLSHFARREEEAQAQRQSTEEALRRSEERFALVTAGSNDGMWDWDLRTNQIYFSPRSKEIVGYAAAEDFAARPEAWLEQVHPSDRERYTAEMQAHIDGQLLYFQSEVRLRSKDGSYVWVLARGRTVRDAEGRPYRFAGSLTDIQERKEIEAKLKATQEQLRALSSRLLSVQEEERRMVVRALVDGVVLLLNTVRAELSGWSESFGPRQRRARDRIEHLVELINDGVRNVLSLAAEFRPPALDEGGLHAAIRAHLEGFEKMTGILSHVDLPRAAVAIDSDRSTTAFRILQEALTNVARHAAATRVDVRLRLDQEGLLLEVKDNGKGIDVAKLASDATPGVTGMRERAARWGGSVVIEPAPDDGTVVTVRIPLG
jgi:two-component system sensor histidine kinase UhpB